MFQGPGAPLCNRARVTGLPVTESLPQRLSYLTLYKKEFACVWINVMRPSAKQRP